MKNPKQFYNISANGTYILSAESCNLGSVIIGNAGSADATLVLYNSNGGATNPIATIDVGELNGRQIDFDVNCPIGLTIVAAGTSAGNYTITLEGLN